MNIIKVFGWTATILCVTGNTLVVKKINGYLVWFLGTGILTVLAFTRQEWSQVALFIVYEALNIWGFIKWRKENK